MGTNIPIIPTTRKTVPAMIRSIRIQLLLAIRPNGTFDLHYAVWDSYELHQVRLRHQSGIAGLHIWAILALRSLEEKLDVPAVQFL